MNSIQLTLALLPVICSVSVAFCRYLLEKLPSNRRALLLQIVSEVVKAIEQMGATDKKAEATQIILKELKRAGISATSDQISYLIETFVYDLKTEIMNAPTVQIPAVKAPK